MSNIVAKDKLRNPINVGDTVIFMQLNYRNLLVGTIKSISNKTLIIEHPMTNVCSTETKQFHDQVIKIPLKEIKNA